MLHDPLTLGRWLVLLGSAALVMLNLHSMAHTTNTLLVWLQAMLALIFSVAVFSTAVALLIGTSGPAVMGYAIIFDGSVRVAVALIGYIVLIRRAY